MKCSLQQVVRPLAVGDELQVHVRPPQCQHFGVVWHHVAVIMVWPVVLVGLVSGLRRGMCSGCTLYGKPYRQVPFSQQPGVVGSRHLHARAMDVFHSHRPPGGAHGKRAQHRIRTRYVSHTRPHSTGYTGHADVRRTATSNPQVQNQIRCNSAGHGNNVMLDVLVQCGFIHSVHVAPV